MLPETTITMTRTIAGISGVAVLLATVRYVVKKGLGASFPLLFVLSATSLGLLSLALFPEWAALFMPDTRMGRIRLAVAGLTVFILIVTFESIRRTQLKERYALLWVLPCILVLVMTAWPGILRWARNTFGMEYGSTMLAAVFLSVMAAVFFLSKSISKNERDISRISQRCAMLEARIRELEAASDKEDAAKK